MRAALVLIIGALAIFANGEVYAVGTCASSYADQYGSIDRSVSAHGSVNFCGFPDVNKPLFTRVGTLSCDTRVGYSQAITIRNYSWHLVPLAGSQYHGRVPLNPDGTATPAFLGCTVHTDGDLVAIVNNDGSNFVFTNIGWVAMYDLRNSPADEEAARRKAQRLQKERLRPTICYPDIPRYEETKRGKCFYTDVHPYALVPSGK